jgi:secreted Zn-dependent insulinase-like peptidase
LRIIILYYWSEKHTCFSYCNYLQKWVEKAPKDGIHLPKPNIFIPSDLSLKNVEEKVRHTKTYSFAENAEEYLLI